MKKNKSLLDSLKQRLRFVIIDEQTLEELNTMGLSRFQILTRILSILLLIAMLTTLLIAYTPLREFIPGYSPPHLSKDLVHLSIKTDSLLANLKIKEQKQFMLERILKGESIEDSLFSDSVIISTIKNSSLKASHQDSLYREAIEREDRFNVLSEETEKPTTLQNIAFYAPIKGMISSKFDIKKEHYGVDVVAPENEAIKASLPGTVILSGWTTETGYTIAIQHENNLISFYKHNSVLLKKLEKRF